MPILRRAYNSDGKEVDFSSREAVLKLTIPYISGEKTLAEISAEIQSICGVYNHPANIVYRRRLEEARRRMPRGASGDVLNTRMG